MRSWWRASVFFAVLLAATGLGIYWHLNAGGHDIDLARRTVPLKINVYAADRGATVSLYVTLQPVHGDAYQVRLYGTSTTHSGLLVTATRPGKTPDGQVFGRLSPDRGGDLERGHFVATFLEAQQVKTLNTDWLELASFDIPARDIVTMKDGYAARFPALADVESGVSDAVYGSVDSGVSLSAGSLYLLPAAIDDPYPSAGDQAIRKPPAALRTHFYEPHELQTSEALLDARSLVTTGDVTINYPSNGTLESGAFVWRGEYALSPELAVVSRAAQDSRARYGFLSGIALATAVAALIALVQELPPRLTIRRWLRRRNDGGND
jgi:hypothetical protein